MNYSELTKIQKRCIDAFIKIRPELATQVTITRPEVEDLFQTLFEARALGGEKIGYPMWLVKGDKLGRGIYEFPAPEFDADELTEATPKVAKPKPKQVSAKVEEEDKEFFTDLQKYGIMETA
jgi:hypothetical protein